MPKKKKPTEKPLGVPSIESPTWGDLIDTATAVLDVMGGPSGAASKLSYQHYYTLCILSALNLNVRRRGEFILGKQYLT